MLVYRRVTLPGSMAGFSVCEIAYTRSCPMPSGGGYVTQLWPVAHTAHTLQSV